MTDTTSAIPVEIWHGCYDGSWRGLMTPAAFAHPAKFAPGLISRIYQHGLAVGWWKRGDTIGDPFGGVAGGGIFAGYHGLNWVGVELEEKFVALGNENLELHGAKWMAAGHASRVVLKQGDSRCFAEIVGADALLTSPPYAETVNGTKDGIDWEKADPKWDTTDRRSLGRGAISDGYGSSDGQIGALKSGSIDAILTSPVYADGGQGGGGDAHPDPTRVGEHSNGGSLRDGYGKHADQIGNCRQGSVDAVITSPPYDEGLGHGGGAKMRIGDVGRGDRAYTAAFAGGYGSAVGQVGELVTGLIDAAITSPPFGDEQPCASQTRAKRDYHDFTRGDAGKRDQLQRGEGNIAMLGAGETYWQAMHQVYSQCLLALRPGGVMAFVVKDYVKNKQRVPLCDQTLRLLEHLGFTPVCWIRAMLVKERRHAGLFQEEHVTRTERKSFFRRLAEKKGSPRIDWEEVLVVRAPVATGSEVSC